MRLFGSQICFMHPLNAKQKEDKYSKILLQQRPLTKTQIHFITCNTSEQISSYKVRRTKKILRQQKQQKNCNNKNDRKNTTKKQQQNLKSSLLSYLPKGSEHSSPKGHSQVRFLHQNTLNTPTFYSLIFLTCCEHFSSSNMVICNDIAFTYIRYI